MSVNPNLFIWSSDWHVGRQGAAHTQGAANYIASLEPAGVIDLGDCREHAGTSLAELDDYRVHVLEVVPWATAVGAPHPVLPGNHDEVLGYDDPGATDYSPFDSALWPAPYHWRADWSAPRVRFLAFHSTLVHPPDPLSGAGAVSLSERQWLETELGALPDGWSAIVCSHFPANPAFGNYIWAGKGGDELRAILAAHSSRIVAYLNGHRHENMQTNVLSGITHFNGPSISYTQGNGDGGLVPIDYDAAARTLTFRYLRAVAPFVPFVGYTPVVVQLPPSDVTTITYTFAADALLVGAGPLAGSPVSIAGTLEA